VLFREWLREIASRNGDVKEFDALMERLKHVQSGGPYTRDEMNER